VRVPANAATGKAKVTLSFPAWKEKDRPVAPATLEIPVIDPPAAPSAPKR